MQADKKLIPTTNDGWSAGFLNMLRMENTRWWNLRSLAIQLIVWSMIMNGFVALMVFAVPSIEHTPGFAQAINNSTDAQTQQLAASGYFNTTPEQNMNNGLQIFFGFGSLVLLIGAVILAHDSILKERQMGTAAWLLSKPLSRKAFVLSKILANAFGMLVIVVIVQGALAYAMCSFALGRPVALMAFLAALGILGLYTLFYLVLSLIIGVFTTSRVAALGIPLITGLIAGDIVTTLWKDSARFMPWPLGNMAVNIATGIPLSSIDIFPIIATAAWIIIFIAIATWRFDGAEL